MKRVHSLTGVVPVGLFLVYHLYGQLYLHHGAAAYDARVNAYYDSPLAWAILVLVVYLPLLFHSVYGLKLCADMNLQTEYTYFQHILYWLQRLSGVGVLLFLGGHLYQAKIKPMIEGVHEQHFNHLHAGFNDPQFSLVTMAVYALGILGSTFHLANGLNTFCITWGIATTPKSQERVRALSILFFLLLAGMAFYSIAALKLK